MLIIQRVLLVVLDMVSFLFALLLHMMSLA